MYKIFINNNSLFISDSIIKKANNIEYKDANTLLSAVELLFNSDEEFINIYGNNIDIIWNSLVKNYKNIIAAGGIVSNKEEKILFIKRNDVWDLPKGKVEQNENIEEAAIREVEEECSIKNLIIVKFIAKTYHIYFYNEYILKTTHWFSMISSDKSTPKPQIEEEITEAVWKEKNEIPYLLKNTYKNIIELINIYERSN